MKSPSYDIQACKAHSVVGKSYPPEDKECRSLPSKITGKDN